MKLETAFKRQCEGIAVDWRYHLGLRAFAPLAAECLLEAFNGKALSPDQMRHLSATVAEWFLTTSEPWSGCVLTLNPLLIVYNPTHSPARHQSNIMHEMAHVILEHPMVGFSPETGLPLRDPRCEDEAIYLGSCLQIPRIGLQWAVNQGYDREKIAEYFGASIEMVRFRSNMTRIKIDTFS